MEITIIIGLLLFVVCAILLLKFIKNIFAAVFSILLLSIFFVAGMGFFVYSDVIDIKDNFPVSNNLVLLQDSEQVLTGLVILPSAKFDPAESMKSLSPTLIEKLNEKDSDKARLGVVKSSDYYDESYIEERGYNDESYMLFSIDLSVIKDSSVKTFDFSDIVPKNMGKINLELAFDKEILLEILKSDDAMDIVFENVGFNYVPQDMMPKDVDFEDFGGEFNISLLNESLQQKILEEKESMKNMLKENLKKQFGSDDIRPVIFMGAITYIAKHNKLEGAKYLFGSFKSSKIDVYPSSFLIDVARLSPKPIVARIIDEASQGIGEIEGVASDYMNSSEKGNETKSST